MRGGLGLGVALLLLALGCAPGFTPPPAPTMAEPPATAALAELLTSYGADPVLADARYLGRRLYFRSLTAETVRRPGPQVTDNFLIVGDAKFIPRYRDALDNIMTGTVVDVSGDCAGFMTGYLTFRDCWFHIVGGPTTVPAGY